MARFPLRYARSYQGNATPSSEDNLEAASQTFVIGSLLIASAGLITIAGTNPTTGLVGVAEQNGNNDAGSLTTDRYIPIVPGMVFEISVDKASGLGGASANIAQSSLYTGFGVTKDANGIWYLDVDKAGANVVVMPVAFRDPPGTIQGRVYVMFKNSTLVNA